MEARRCRYCIVVATYNRSSLLQSLLESLEEQAQALRDKLLVCVVDNNSSDDTARVAEAFRQKLPLVYLQERTQGKTHALNAALAQVPAEVYLFVDDDVIVDAKWLPTMITAAERMPEFAWFGGKVLPNWENRKPGWFRAETGPAFSGYFIDYSIGDESRPYRADDNLPLGASMMVRREVFDCVGHYRTDLGPRGGSRGVGDDTELILRAIDAGFAGYYIADAICFHYVDPDRLRPLSFFKYGLARGGDQYRCGVDDFRNGSLLVVAAYVPRLLLQLLKGRVDRAYLCVINIGLEIGRWKAARTPEALP